MTSSQQPENAPGATASESGNSQMTAPAGDRPEQLIYAMGRLDVRFPSLGIEREFQQRERQIAVGKSSHPARRGERLMNVLKAHPHLARSVTYVLSVVGMPTFSVVPTGSQILEQMLDALPRVDESDGVDLVIGRGGPMADPATTGGLLVQLVACDAFYSFTIENLVKDLVKKAEAQLKAIKEKVDHEAVARELFLRILNSTDNIGSLDTHRALNYLMVQHPGPYIAAISRSNTATLDNIETRLAQGPSGRRIVTAIFTFVDRATGVPERLFTRVDVTEEWPFAVDSVIALAPFVDTGAPGGGM